MLTKDLETMTGKKIKDVTLITPETSDPYLRFRFVGGEVMCIALNTDDHELRVLEDRL